MVWSNVFACHGMLNPPQHLLALPAPKLKAERGSSEPWKNQGFPEYIVDVTRKSLLSFTTSLTKVSSQAHDFFASINFYFAFERMTRNCFGWMMPTAGAAPMGPMGMAMPQMWAMPDWFAPAPRLSAQPKALEWFGAQLLALPKPQPKPAPMMGMAANMPDYGAMLALPAMFFSLMPAVMQAWNPPV